MYHISCGYKQHEYVAHIICIYVIEFKLVRYDLSPR